MTSGTPAVRLKVVIILVTSRLPADSSYSKSSWASNGKWSDALVATG
jgi:hypothetical protein